MSTALIPTVAQDALTEGRGAGSSAFEQAATQVIAAKRSPHTRRAYEADLRAWLLTCATSGTDPSAATLRDSTAFRDQLGAKAAPGSVRRALAALSTIYATLREGGVARSNPFSPKVLAWPVEQSSPTPLVEDKDARAMLSACGDGTKTGMRDAAVLALLYWTGLRRSSVSAIEMVNVIEQAGRLIVRTVVKGGRMTEKLIPPEAASILRGYLKGTKAGQKYLFPGELDKPLAPSSINELVDRRAKLAGCYGRVSPHSFRAAFATSAYDADVPERSIADALDHRRVETTRRYDRKQRGDRAIEEVAASRQAPRQDPAPGK